MTESLSLGLIEYITNTVKTAAKDKRTDAAFSGSWGDNGAQEMEDMLRIWLDGINGRVPNEFKKFEKTFNKERDSDYAEYKRLKAKFENND